MISSLRGILVNLTPTRAIVECAGVGYDVRIPLTTFDAIRDKTNTEIILRTRAIYREDAALLYGFYDQNEYELFDFIRSLPGIGPSLSLNLISHLGANGLTNILLQSKTDALVKVPGVGKVKAEKIAFEAKSREKKLKQMLSSGTTEYIQSNDIWAQQLEDALVSLGYQKKEIDRAADRIKNSDESLPELTESSLQDHLRAYLKNL